MMISVQNLNEDEEVFCEQTKMPSRVVKTQPAGLEVYVVAKQLEDYGNFSNLLYGRKTTYLIVWEL